jgi:hypothetical protein
VEDPLRDPAADRKNRSGLAIDVAVRDFIPEKSGFDFPVVRLVLLMTEE